MKTFKKSVMICLLITLTIGVTGALYAQNDQGYIYGKITMDNGRIYQGVIRWGDEEAFWDDMFNSTKVENVLDLYFSDADLDALEEEYDSRDRRRRRRRSWDFGFLAELFDHDGDLPGDMTHQFKCLFGDIKSMEFRGRESVLLTLKNGDELRVRGGSNDVGTSIMVMDEELDEVKLKWRRIDMIEFMPTPKRLEAKFGDPLYGEVETRGGKFKGFIQWDHDECLSTDILDGDSDDGDMKIRFGKIRSIEKYRRGSKVILKSGREYYLTGSNDVDDDNRGVVVKDPEIGKILIGWRDFDKITFIDTDESGEAYDSYKAPKMLHATIKMRNDESLSGRILYDLDEAYDFEVLDGEDGRIEFLIPFRNIKRIVPERSYGSLIVLQNGAEYDLEDARDVDEDNDGIVIWPDGEKIKYIAWRQINEIIFD